MSSPDLQHRLSALRSFIESKPKRVPLQGTADILPAGYPGTPLGFRSRIFFHSLVAIAISLAVDGSVISQQAPVQIPEGTLTPRTHKEENGYFTSRPHLTVTPKAVVYDMSQYTESQVRRGCFPVAGSLPDPNNCPDSYVDGVFTYPDGMRINIK